MRKKLKYIFKVSTLVFFILIGLFVTVFAVKCVRNVRPFFYDRQTQKAEAQYEKNISELYLYQKMGYEDIPAYDGASYVEINGNIPFFEKDELNVSEMEYYSELDKLGRCGTAVACLCLDLMPTEERGQIGSIKPSGWHTVKYPELIDDLYLFNRCHLIAYCLAGENANEKNLITGTRYMNVKGMLPFENKVAKYIESTGNHVLYRVTPIFVGDELVARGVEIEGYSIEDSGRGICMNVFVYNVQPGIEIDYLTGESWVISK